MSIWVTELDLNQPLPDLTLPEGASGAFILVRQQGCPVGLVRLSAVTGRYSPAQLKAAIEAQVKIPVCPAEASPASQPVSVVICTRERPADLSRCLEALRPFAAGGHQVIVVDNAPTTQATRETATQFPYHYVAEPLPGLNYARNRGLTVACHPIVAFIDDDCVADPAWLDGLTAPYVNPQVGATTGLVLPLELATEAQLRFETYCANRRIFDPRRYRAPHPPPSAAGVVGMGANMSFRQELLRELGGFDVRFDGGTPTLSGGDTEMFARVLAAGSEIVYTPQALVWHRHRRQMEALRQTVFGYGVGLYSFLTKQLVEDGDLTVLSTAPRWLIGPPLKALCNRLRGRPAAAPNLVWLEFWGALHGPLRYYQVRRKHQIVDINPTSPSTFIQPKGSTYGKSK